MCVHVRIYNLHSSPTTIRSTVYLSHRVGGAGYARLVCTIYTV